MDMGGSDTSQGDCELISTLEDGRGGGQGGVKTHLLLDGVSSERRRRQPDGDKAPPPQSRGERQSAAVHMELHVCRVAAPASCCNAVWEMFTFSLCRLTKQRL